MHRFHFIRRCLSSFNSNSLLKNKCYINGKWVDSATGKVFPVYNPASLEKICDVPDMTQRDVDDAISAATISMDGWANMSCKERSRYLRRLYDNIEKYANDIAQLITAEMGKPMVESKTEVAYGGSFIEWFSEEAKRVIGDLQISPFIKDSRVLVQRHAVGVCALITPWNFPLAMATRKVGAALAAGCSVVLKPSEDTPLTSLALAELADMSEIPAGVFNVITTSRQNVSEVSKFICASKNVRKISFTGSSEVGKLLMSQCASTVKRMSLELSGNAPFIVFESANIDDAVDGIIACKFRNAGQTCVSANRIFVHDAIYDRLSVRLAEAVSKLHVGDGFLPDTKIGPLINEKAVGKVKRHVDSSKNQGAKVLLGGDSASNLGKLFYQPTVLTNVSQDSVFATEETFGPVAPLIRFSDESEVLKLANSTASGLAGYFYSNDASQIFRVSERLEVGMIGVNQGSVSSEMVPFGGIKESGIGREGSVYGIDEYLEHRLVNIKL